MGWSPIEKPIKPGALEPNLRDYEETRRTFSWTSLDHALKGSIEGLNIADIAIDRHTHSGSFGVAQSANRANHIALRFLAKDGQIKDFTYQDLKVQTNRFANVLQTLGVSKGDRVFALAGRIPALYITALGTLKNGSVFCPLFSAFDPEPVFQRMDRGDAKVLVTTQLLYKQKVASLRSRLPKLQHILLADIDEDLEDGIWSLPKLMAEASSNFAIVPTDPEDMALLHFTSGTTGMPKGAIHVHKAVYAHYMTANYVLDLHPEDVFLVYG